MTKSELQAKVEEITGAKPNPQLSKPQLEKIIEDAENRNSTDTEDAGEPGNQAGTESDREVIPDESKVKEKTPDQEIEAQISAARKVKEVKDKKRHLVYKDGQEVWWTPSVIEVMLKSYPDRISFPENTQYVATNIKTCKDCG